MHRRSYLIWSPVINGNHASRREGMGDGRRLRNDGPHFFLSIVVHSTVLRSINIYTPVCVRATFVGGTVTQYHVTRASVDIS